MIFHCGNGVATVVSVERWIVDYLRLHEDSTQRALLEAAKAAQVGSDRTVRGHLGRLDGVMIKRVREGREVRLESIEYWRRREHQTFDLRVPHTVKLKTVLDQFRSQLPVVQELPLQAVPPFQYRPDVQLEAEGHALFDDLLFHLGLLKLSTDPSPAWSEFKKQASRFRLARDALWKRCAETASEALGLPLGTSWTGRLISEHCVALFYNRALAAAGNEKEREDPFQDANVVLLGDAMEYWLGGRGILRRRRKRPIEPKEVTKEVTRELKHALNLTKRSDFRSLAEPVVDSVKQLRAIREGLHSALVEASFYEVFPGMCRFTGAT